MGSQCKKINAYLLRLLDCIYVFWCFPGYILQHICSAFLVELVRPAVCLSTHQHLMTASMNKSFAFRSEPVAFTLSSESLCASKPVSV